MIRSLIGRGFALALIVLGVVCVNANAAHATWLKAESPLFVVYSDGDPNELRDFVGELHEYDRLLRLMTGTTAPAAPNKLPIYLAKNSRQFHEAIPYASDGIAGLYNSTPHATLAVALRKDLFGLSARTIIRHEYTHHFMLQYHPAFYPPWYVEGFAEYFGATQFKDAVMNVGAATPGRAWSLQTQPWAPIRDVIDPASGSKVTGQFYEESWLTVSWFMAAPERRMQLKKFLIALGQGQAPEAALKAATGLDFDALDEALRDYLKKRELPGFQVRRSAQAVDVAVTKVPEAEGKFLLMNARLLMNYDKPEEVARLLPRLRKDAARYADDASALRTLALAEIKAGDFAHADRTLAKLDGAAPTDVNTPYLHALRYIEDGRARPAQRDGLWEQARGYAARAIARDENHYASLYLYALAAMKDGEKPDAATLNALLRAYELAPNVEEFRLESAIALLRTGKTSEAKQLLLPLAYAPHYKGGADFARNLLVRLNAGEEIGQALGNFSCDCRDAKNAAQK